MAKRKVPNVTREASSIGEFDQPWHRLDKKDMGAEVSRLFDTFRKEQSARRSRYVRNLEMYENRRLGGHTAHSYLGNDDQSDWQNPDRLGIIRSMVSSAVSSVYAPQKPKPQFQTLGATWATRRKAYRLDRICEGIINQREGDYVNVWAMTLDAAVDCVLQGVAPIKVIADTEQMRICHKLIPHPDIFTDPAEGRSPKNLFQREPIDATLALELWPKARQAIIGSRPYDWFGRSSTQRPRSTKVIELQYAWRLPYGPKKPGRWCAVINSEVVDDGEWTAPTFPFVWLGWERHRDGFWWSGVGDEVGTMAAGAAELDLRLYYRMLVASGKKVFYTEGTVNPDDLMLNEAVVGVAVQPNAPMPQESLTPPFSPMELEFRDSKVRDVWDAAGISQVSAAARREPNITSGIAQLTLNDTKAGRQLTKGQRYEQLFVDLAHQYMWRLRELKEKEPDFAVKYPGKNMLRSYKVADSDLPDDEFSVTVAPSSALPHDPAGRQEMVSQLFSGGLIDQEQAKNLIGWPDLEGELNIENAESEYVDMLIDKYLDAEESDWEMGDYQGPEGFLLNKMYALRRFVSAWARARVDQAVLPLEEQNTAEFNIDLLTRYIKELVQMMAPPVERAGPGPQVQGPPGPLPPPGAGPMPGAPPAGGPMPGPPGPPMMPAPPGAPIAA